MGSDVYVHIFTSLSLSLSLSLIAYSTESVLVNPTHYTREPGWSSDTDPPVEELERIQACKKTKGEEKVSPNRKF